MIYRQHTRKDRFGVCQRGTHGTLYGMPEPVASQGVREFRFDIPGIARLTSKGFCRSTSASYCEKYL
jgi:hypothetical protein